MCHINLLYHEAFQVITMHVIIASYCVYNVSKFSRASYVVKMEMPCMNAKQCTYIYSRLCILVATYDGIVIW